MTLALMVLFLAVMRMDAHAEACLTIDVPPQAVLDQYDGDTFTLFTFGPGGKLHIRVQGVDTPERNKKEQGWEEARLFTMKWLAMGDFTVKDCGVMSIDRHVASVSRDGETLAQALIAAGHNKEKAHGKKR